MARQTFDQYLAEFRETQQAINAMSDSTHKLYGDYAYAAGYFGSMIADLVAQLGEIAGVARDLAYRLYSTCERKKWAQEALAYNSLVVAWPELTKLARTVKQRRVETQKEMF